MCLFLGNYQHSNWNELIGKAIFGLPDLITLHTSIASWEKNTRPGPEYLLEPGNCLENC